jgi:hypothetical protein
MDDNKNVLDEDLYYFVTDILERSNVLSYRFINKIRHPGLMIVHEYIDVNQSQWYIYNTLTKHKDKLFNTSLTKNITTACINNSNVVFNHPFSKCHINVLSHKTDTVDFDGIVIDGDNLFFIDSRILLLYKISDSKVKLSYYQIVDNISNSKIACHGKYIVYTENKKGVQCLMTHIIDTLTSVKICRFNGTYSFITGHGRLIKVDNRTPPSTFVYDLIEQTKVCEGKIMQAVNGTKEARDILSKMKQNRKESLKI